MNDAIDLIEQVMSFIVSLRSHMKSKYILAIVLLSALLVRLVPALISPYMLGMDAYYHVDVAERFFTGDLDFFSTLNLSSLGIGSYPVGFHALLAGLATLGIPLSISAKFLPAILGVLTTLIFYLFAKELIPEKQALLASFLFTTCPIVVQRTAQAIPETLGIVFFVTALWMIAKIKKTKSVLYLIPLALISILYLFTHRGIFFLGIIAIIAFFTLWEKTREPKIAVPLVILAAISAIYWLPPLYEMLKRLPWEPVSAKGFLLAPGVMVLLAIPGLIIAYMRMNSEDKFLLSWTILFALVGMLSFRFRDPYLMFPLAMLAAVGFYEYVQPTFTKPRKILAIALILIILQIGIAAYMIPRPSAEEYNTLTWIDQNTPQDSIVLSWKEEGYWINGIAYRKDVILWEKLYKGLYGEPSSLKEMNETYNQVETIFRTTNKSLSMELLKKFNVSYIYVDKKMAYKMESLEYGLLEYIDTSKDFSKAYEEGGARVYEVVQDGTRPV